MNKILKLADKFAMKLSLESRPAPSDLSPYEPTLDDIEPIEVPQNDELSQPQTVTTRDYLNPIRAAMHNIGEALDFGSFAIALQLIDNTKYQLQLLETHVKIKLKKSKKASFDAFATGTLPYDEKIINLDDGTLPYDEKFINPQLEDDGETVFQEVDSPPFRTRSLTPPEHLPSVIKEYLKNLDYMDRDQLYEERKYIKQKVKYYAQQGYKPPYPLKKRLEEVERRLLHTSRWF